MKKETSMKICNSFKHVYRAGYCELQYIAPKSIIEPQYYNAGLYGWNCDLYVDYASDTIITTGYRNTRGTKIPQDLLDKYSKRAAHIKNMYAHDAYYENFQEFIKELNER